MSFPPEKEGFFFTRKGTFNLPDFNDKAPWWTPNGAGNTGTGSAPKIWGTFSSARFGYRSDYEQSGALYITERNNTNANFQSNNSGIQLNFDASRCSGTYNRTDNKITPSYLKIGGWLIKYI